MSHRNKRRVAALALAGALALAAARPLAAAPDASLWSPAWLRLTLRLTSLLQPAAPLAAASRLQSKRGLEIDPGGCPDNTFPAPDGSCVAVNPPTRTAP